MLYTKYNIKTFVLNCVTTTLFSFSNPFNRTSASYIFVKHCFINGYKIFFLYLMLPANRTPGWVTFFCFLKKGAPKCTLFIFKICFFCKLCVNINFLFWRQRPSQRLPPSEYALFNLLYLCFLKKPLKRQLLYANIWEDNHLLIWGSSSADKFHFRLFFSKYNGINLLILVKTQTYSYVHINYWREPLLRHMTFCSNEA